MITAEQHDKRTGQIYSQMRYRFGIKRWKSGKREGLIRYPATPMPFTLQEFRQWCWDRLGLRAIGCPYCNVPIDILNASIDHMVPVSRGGGIGLDNLMPICQPCNLLKGAFTDEEYTSLMVLLAGPQNAFLRAELLKRLKDAANGSRERFFRGKRNAA